MRKNITENNKDRAIAEARRQELNEFKERELLPKGLRVSVNITPMLSKDTDILTEFETEKRHFEKNNVEKLIKHHEDIVKKKTNRIKEDLESLKESNDYYLERTSSGRTSNIRKKPLKRREKECYRK